MTQQLYYSDSYLKEFDAVVISSEPLPDGNYSVILDRTAFYPEGGGQPGDRGTIQDTQVIDTQIRDDIIEHICTDTFAAGTAVHCILDWERRLDLMQQHSGEHIISGMICSALHCDNVGFHLGEETVTIDYNKYASPERIREIEKAANRYIAENHDTEIFTAEHDELTQLSYRSKKDFETDVRIVSFPGADTCACCGTHLSSSSQVLAIKVISQKKFHDGIRLEILCGNRAIRYLMDCSEQNTSIGQSLSAPSNRTYESVLRLIDQNNELKQNLAELEEEIFQLTSEHFINKGNTYIIKDEMDPVSLRRLCESIFRKCNGFCVVFSGSGTSFRYALMSEESRFSSLLHDINTNLNGKGGGRDGLAQGNVNSDRESIETFMKNLI